MVKAKVFDSIKGVRINSDDYTLIRSRRRRSSASLEVKSGGEVVVHAPWYMPKFMLDKFVSEHKVWINRQKIKVKSAPLPKDLYFKTLTDLENFIKKELAHYEQLMGLTATSIKFRKVRTYWGCCNRQGGISFNYELLYVPESAVSYVVVHELAHLRYMGHGVRFWELVNKHFPDTKNMRRLLREHQRGIERPTVI